MEELERIIEALKNGEKTSTDDWQAVAEYYDLVGETNAETITNIENFVLDHFSFEAAAENPYVYFGTDGNANIWQCVDGICKDSANNAVYISSTDAGVLFNDSGFNGFLKKNLDKGLFDNTSGITPLYEGTNASGKITLQAANGESVKVQAFNDFFSENYIKGIKSSNVKTIFSGDILARNGEGLNAFCRTEFEAIINNSNIKTINGIDKEILFELKNAAPKGKEYQYVTDVLKASQVDQIKDLYYIKDGKSIIVASKEIAGGEKMIDNLIANNKLEITSIDNIIKDCKDSLSLEARSTLENIAAKNDKKIAEILIKDADNISRISNSDTFVAEKLNERLTRMLLRNDSKAAEYIAKNSDDITRLLADNSDDLGKAFIENLASKKDEKLLEYLVSNSDDVLKVANKEAITIGEYTIEQGGKITQQFADGTMIEVSTSDVISAEEAVAQGYAPVKGTKDLYWGISKDRVLKFINIVSGVLVIYEGGKTFNRAWDEYDKGNYRTGSKILTTYAMESAGAAGGSALLPFLCKITGASLSLPTVIFGTIAFTIVGGIFGHEIGGDFGDWLCDLLGYEDEVYATGLALSYVKSDPLIIDLDNDGFELLSASEGVYFDEDSKGLIEKTAWVGADDALLAVDLNNNGRIDSGAELFGTSAVLPDGTLAKSGFEALRVYDSNDDGIIDKNDNDYDKLLVWQDKNSNGQSEANELKSLADMGIESISLSTNIIDSINTSIVSYKDGHNNNLGEFYFDAQYYNTRENDFFNSDIKSKGNTVAIGEIASLETLINADTSGLLKEMVNEFINSSSIMHKKRLLKDILYKISGSDEIESDSRGSFFDAKKLNVIEKCLGKKFKAGDNMNPTWASSTILETVYNDIIDAYFYMMECAVDLEDYIKLLIITTDERGYKCINTDLFDTMIDLKKKCGEDVTDLVGKMGLYIKTFTKSNPESFNKYIDKYKEDRAEFSEIITFCYDGVYIDKESGDTRLLFGKEIKPEDIIKNRQRDDLIITYSEYGQITIKGAYNLSGDNNIESFEFEDGSIMSFDEIYSGPNDQYVTYGTETDDNIYAEVDGRVVYGLDGNDELSGEFRNSVLIGGKGDDTLRGGQGEDIYVFSRGDGIDSIYEKAYTFDEYNKVFFDDSVSIGDVHVVITGNDERNLTFIYSDNDAVTVYDALYMPGAFGIDDVAFNNAVYEIDYAGKCLYLKEFTKKDPVTGNNITVHVSRPEEFIEIDGPIMEEGPVIVNGPVVVNGPVLMSVEPVLEDDSEYISIEPETDEAVSLGVPATAEPQLLESGAAEYDPSIDDLYLEAEGIMKEIPFQYRVIHSKDENTGEDIEITDMTGMVVQDMSEGSYIEYVDVPQEITIGPSPDEGNIWVCM